MRNTTAFCQYLLRPIKWPIRYFSKI